MVPKAPWDKFFMHCGLPEKVLSNQGCNFESKLIAELCELSQSKEFQTTPYRPQCNGQCECFNSTLISMIGTLPTETKIKFARTIIHIGTCLQL